MTKQSDSVIERVISVALSVDEASSWLDNAEDDAQKLQEIWYIAKDLNLTFGSYEAFAKFFNELHNINDRMKRLYSNNPEIQKMVKDHISII